MSGYSERTNCPRCGSEGSLDRSVDRDDVNATCIECGYEYHTVESVLSLDEVNDERVAWGLEPVSELKPPVTGWKG